MVNGTITADCWCKQMILRENIYPHIITFFADVAKKENEQFKVLK